MNPQPVILAMLIHSLYSVYFLKAIQKVVAACHAAGKFCITYCDSAQKARQYFAMNFDSATIGLDVCILVDGYRQVVREALQEA